MPNRALLRAMTTHKPDIFQSVRNGFAAVAAQATHVKIRYDRIDEYADSLPPAPPANVFDETHHYLGSEEDTAAYVLALDAINFGSGYKPLMVKEGWRLIDGSIYFTVSTRLKNEFERAAPWDAARMAALTDEDCRRVLELPRGQYSDEFAGLCRAALNELGVAVGGRFMDYVPDTAAALTEKLSALPHFKDVHDYNGLSVPILKRAQIAAADLHLAFAKLGRDLFPDAGQVTMFADNAVPHVLRTDGILEYTPELAAKIAAGTYLASGSAEEIEIRACAGHAVELIAAKKGLKALNIDHILWHRSAENVDYRKSVTHRTLTPFY